jgi:hypothetical protein
MRVMAFGFDCHTRTVVLVMRCAVLDAKRLEARECNALLLCEAADSFAFLHSLSILRRDTAYCNLLLDANDHALVADLGYARKLAADKDCCKSESAERPLEVDGRRGAKHAQGRRVHVFGRAMWEALARGAAFCECCFDFDTLKRLVLGDTHPARAPLCGRARAAARHDASGDATRRDRGGRASWRVRSGETSRSRPPSARTWAIAGGVSACRFSACALHAELCATRARSRRGTLLSAFFARPLAESPRPKSCAAMAIATRLETWRRQAVRGFSPRRRSSGWCWQRCLHGDVPLRRGRVGR